MQNIAYTITKDGASGYLFPMLKRLNKVTDYILISVSEKSTDNTYDKCVKSELVDDVITEDMNFPQEEHKIRANAYEYAVDKNPDADRLVALDDDEIIPNTRIFKKTVEYDAPYNGVVLRHLWKDYSYRKDNTWNNILRVIIKDPSKPKGKWGKGIHADRVPETSNHEGGAVSPVLHFGWDIPEKERIEKMKAKEELSENPSETQRKHYDSLNKKPRLKRIPERWEWLVDHYGHRKRT